MWYDDNFSRNECCVEERREADDAIDIENGDVVWHSAVRKHYTISIRGSARRCRRIGESKRVNLRLLVAFEL